MQFKTAFQSNKHGIPLLHISIVFHNRKSYDRHFIDLVAVNLTKMEIKLIKSAYLGVSIYWMCQRL